MNRKFLISVMLVCIVSLSGCLYSKIKFPLDTDLQTTTLGTKVGRASNHSILWLVAWGDAGTEAAAENGKLSVINHLDVEQMIILFGLYTKQTTVAYGN